MVFAMPFRRVHEKRCTVVEPIGGKALGAAGDPMEAALRTLLKEIEAADVPPRILQLAKSLQRRLDETAVKDGHSAS